LMFFPSRWKSCAPQEQLVLSESEAG